MEFRFYVPRMVLCPECGDALDWERAPRMGGVSGMRLRHHDNGRCSRAGKVFFAPQLQVDLTEWVEP
jgi:uncharacterized OB-fold protein